MAAPVFISYRRSDSQHATGRLFARLAPRYLAPAEIFMDIEAIAAGADFRKALDARLRDCKVCLVMIGPDWLEKDESGHTRIDDPADVVHQEVAAALASHATVIPVLVDNARMPSAAELPAALEPLAARNAVRLVHERFDGDADTLAATVLSALGRSLDRELEVLTLLFSFRGTINRKQFWIGLAILLPIYLAMHLALMAALGVPLGEWTEFDTKYPIGTQVRNVTELGLLWSWWPSTALAWKRIKDLGHGWDLLVFFLAALFLHYAMTFSGENQTAEVLLASALTMLLMFGLMKGTRFIAHHRV